MTKAGIQYARRLVALLAMAAALVGTGLARRAAERGGDPALTQANVQEARVHFGRILPLMRNWHNTEAALEIRAVAGHLDVAGRASGMGDAELDQAIATAREVAGRLTGQGTGVPANTAEALGGLEKALQRMDAVAVAQARVTGH